jgi:hypothetical protein
LFFICSLSAVQDFADMAEAHEWTLRRLREMAGRLTEQAYLRASEAAGSGLDPEAAARWMLVFDRMARGLRLSIALEARLSRERRWDADETLRESSGERCEPRWRTRAARGADAAPEAEPVECDREPDDDGLPGDAPLARRIGRLKAIIEGAGSIDPPARLSRAERSALEGQRAWRARRAGAAWPPDEPWDIVTPAERAEATEPPFRGSG